MKSAKLEITHASATHGFKSARASSKLRLIVVSPGPTLVPPRFVVPCHCSTPNPAVDRAPFGRWTLRDKVTQRRSPLR
jgi:hypothetical protein